MASVRALFVSIAFGVVFSAGSCKHTGSDQKFRLQSDAGQNSSDFPNFFLDLEKVDGLAREDAKDLLKKATHHIAKHVVVDVIKEDKTAEKVALLSEIASLVKSEQSAANVYLGGGGVKAIWAYLYAEIYKRKYSNPAASVYKILNGLIGSDARYPSREVLGNGSDIDLYIAAKSKRDVDSAIQIVDNYTQKIENANNLGILPEALRRVLSFRMDVKELGPQISRSFKQGGAALNLLALDLFSGDILEPQGGDAIFNDFINGSYEYYRSLKPTKIYTRT